LNIDRYNNLSCGFYKVFDYLTYKPIMQKRNSAAMRMIITIAMMLLLPGQVRLVGVSWWYGLCTLYPLPLPENAPVCSSFESYNFLNF
jgi:hypothetical protein